MSPRETAQLALRGAYSVRKRLGLSLDEPLSPVAAAERLGILVAFVDVPSLEGMYCHEKRTIVLSFHRPPGRRTFTCGHELGHWYFEHGTSVDELKENVEEVEASPEERLADSFARYLLLPPNSVRQALLTRGWSGDSLSAEQCYILASQFGVAFSAMLGHLRYAIGRIGDSSYELLRRQRPKDIRMRLAGVDSPHLVVVDRHWGGMPLDLEEGDLVRVPSDCRIDGSTTSLIGPAPGSSDAIFRAESRGLNTMRVPGASGPIVLRISPRRYKGFSTNRFSNS